MHHTFDSFSPPELIPEWWRLEVADIERLIWLGEVNIREMIRYWRGMARSQVEEVKQIELTLTEIVGLNPGTIRAEANKFENPTFPSVGMRGDSWRREPEPLDAASVTRKSGSTTFNVCGWCKYASGGTCRYNYYITTSCGLKRRAGMQDSDRRFDTPCAWLTATAGQFAHLKSSLQHSKEQAIAAKAVTDRKIRALLKLEKLAEKKPALPDLRPHDWFNVDDPITCYVGSWASEEAKKVFPNSLVTGKVINGYRHHDGCVSVCYDERVHTGPYLEGHGGGYGMSRPEIMHTWEFEYFLNHWEFLGFWLARGAVRKLEGFVAPDMCAAIVEESIKREHQNRKES